MLRTGEGKLDSRGNVWWMRKTLNDQHQTHNIYVQVVTVSRRRPSAQTLLLISQMSRGGELVTHWRGQGIKLLNSMGEFWSQSTAKLSFSLFFLMICLHTCFSPTLAILETPFSGSSSFLDFGVKFLADLALLIANKKFRSHQHVVWESFEVQVSCSSSNKWAPPQSHRSGDKRDNTNP